MWGGTQSDPEGEGSSEAPVCNQELRDLKDQFDQQQVLIAQLKEMLRKSEHTSIMQEKVEEYANTLTRMNARVKKSKYKKDTDATDASVSIDTPAKEKILLLRQQMEENKLKLAERGKLHRGIEETVTQLKAQLDDSQHIISQASINLSLIDPKEDSYSINSTREDLFNIVAIKDKRINDLNTKIQKLEASVLDLQENVKEKDSVIDARTKAITLMTDSLSKKGKSTLDALDDTKEQMRKMQENFINLEAQMNDEKQLLTNQLDTKNKDTLELEKLCNEQNEELRKLRIELSPKKGRKGKKGQTPLKLLDETSIERNECEMHLTKIAQYEATINELNLTIKELKALEVKSKEIEHTDDSDVSKLKKQLDENNKTMIKIKAQHKCKVKELNKTIEELKKNKDGDMEIKRLQEENAKFTEQVSKLTSNNDLANSERVNDLEMKLLEQSEMVESKNQSISTLEEQIIVYKAQVEQLAKFSRLENDQVVSEIQSIDFEEQLDKVQWEKNELQRRYDELIAEKSTLLEAIDHLNKEKQEISAKLDCYIQENIELIDKLEKLSSAKVSSAESIEIVEGLTQQEKLELEEYQKHLEIPDNIKNSVENLESAGLNESVNQLTEETSDLLRKIELFTEERREVMDKMEALAIENAHLNMKMCEVENNRDILAETYEQVQNEKEDLETKLEHEKEKRKKLESSLVEKITILQKENKILQEKINTVCLSIKHDDENGEEVIKDPISSFSPTSDLQSQIDEYKALIEIQKQEIQDLKLKLLSQQNLGETQHDLQDKIASLQMCYEALLLENKALAKSVKDNSELVHEKDTLEAELVDVRKKVDEFSEKLKENLVEIENYKSIVQENKNELISSANIINNLQSEIDEKQNEIENYESETQRLNSVIVDLSNRITDIEKESTEGIDNIETMEIMSNQLQELKEILNENIKQIEKYEDEIQTNSTAMNQLTLQLKELKTKLENVEQELESKNIEIAKLIEQQTSKESLITKLQSELKEKDQSFHETFEKLKEKCLGLENKIDENTGSLDKLDLPKIQELELKNKEQLEKMKKIAANLKKRNVAHQELEDKYKQLHINHESLNLDVILKIREIERLTVENSHLRSISENSEIHVSNECNNLNVEINRKNDLIGNLTAELERLHYNSETNTNALHVKIQELEMYIETQDIELNKYKEQVNRLEEGLSALEERRQSLERQTLELGNQLQEKSNSYEEISQIEDILEQRLAMLMSQDKKMERRLRDSTIENQKLQEDNKYLLDENDQLKQKLAHAIERNIDANKLIEMEHEISQLNTNINKAESECKYHCADYERKLLSKSTELENMEIELQGQLMQLHAERKTLIVQCEQLNDEIKEHLITRDVLYDSIEDYKSKLNQQQVDFDSHMMDCQRVTDENKSNLNVIDQLQIQVSDHTSEIDGLKKLFNEKNVEIENYRHENERLEWSMQSLVQQYDAAHNKLSNLQTSNSELLERVKQLSAGAALPESTPEETITTFVWPNQSSNNPFDSIVTSQSSHSVWSNDDPKIINYFKTAPTQQIESHLFQHVESQTFLDGNNSKVFQNVDTQTPHKMFHNAETTTEQYTEVETLSITESVAQKSLQHLLETEKSTNQTNEEHTHKIKTLEFMLFNAEREKDEALFQCQELTGQVARLIYEKQICSHDDTVLSNQECNQLQTVEFAPVNMQGYEETIQPKQAYLCYTMDVPAADIETQILSPSGVQITNQDLQQLQCVEFGKYEPNKASEDICEAKSTYLCYPVDTKSLESQIVTDQDARVTKENLQQLQNIEYTECKELTDVIPSTSAVSEIAEAKTAYLCFKADDTFDENDDGWGCGSEEAKLEADYHQHQQQIDQNAGHIIELNERIHSLEVECDKHSEENKQFHIKSGKLLKKLKEYKTLNEKLEADLRRSDQFAGLDDALQDEFKMQITQLEKRLREIALELEKERSYKTNLLKQVDALQTANERMVKMKEKQDVEVLTWQRQNRELSSKLEQFEWGDGDSESPKHEQRQPDDKINELTTVINELTKDNDELQVLLEEQRNLRIAAEKSKIEGIREEEYLSVVADKDNLKEELTTSLEERKLLQDQLNKLIKINGEVQQQLINLNQEKLSLENQFMDGAKIVTNVTNEMEKLKVSSSNIQNNTLLQNAIEALHSDNLHLQEQLQVKAEKLGEFQTKLASCEHQIAELTHHLRLKSNELLEISNKLETVVREKLVLEESVQLLNDDWSERVAQRGFEIAESWKVHLKSCESEFLQVEQTLKKELGELEGKCLALVNENNELRKNVDAEIRNEIDKMSALQQQINERQLYINDLSQILQGKEEDLERQQIKINDCDILVQQINNDKATLELQITEKLQIIAKLEEKLLNWNDLQNEIDTKTEMISKLQVELTDNQTVMEERLLKLNESNKELNEYKETINLFQQQIENKDEYISELAHNIHENQIQFNLINEELSKRNATIKKLETIVPEHSQLNSVTLELNDLKMLLDKRETEFEEAASEYERLSNLRVQESEDFRNTERLYKDSLSVKNSELETTRLLLSEEEEKYKVLVDNHCKAEDAVVVISLKLNEKTHECEQLYKRIYEQDSLHDEESNQISELGTIIEDQVFKIEALKQELYEKSKDYDSLIAELDIRKPSLLERTPLVPELVREGQVQLDTSTVTNNDDTLEPISRAELDLALYMLHQRDVRCEELTVELMQLLEERDTLQLKLSNAIREREELRRQYLPSYSPTKIEDVENVQISETPSTSPSKVSAIVLGASSTEMATEAVEGSHNVTGPLANKLLELKMVGYRRDKTLVDEQERRRYQQLALMQDHRDIAALLPAEAAAKLVQDASYTLSRDVQSPSKVLLNWLWGRSTPKVNNV